MSFHGAEGQLQRTGDVLIVLALQHFFQDDALARGQVTALAEGGKQLVHVFLGVGRIGTRRLLEAQAQGVGSDAQGEKGQGQKQDVLREVPLADIQGSISAFAKKLESKTRIMTISSMRMHRHRTKVMRNSGS